MVTLPVHTCRWYILSPDAVCDRLANAHLACAVQRSQAYLGGRSHSLRTSPSVPPLSRCRPHLSLGPTLSATRAQSNECNGYIHFPLSRTHHKAAPAHKPFRAVICVLSCVLCTFVPRLSPSGRSCSPSGSIYTTRSTSSRHHAQSAAWGCRGSRTSRVNARGTKQTYSVLRTRHPAP